MKKGIFLPLVIAILAAIVYAMIVSSAQKKLNASKNVKQVFVPLRDIKEREVIKRDFIKPVPVPAAYLQKDAFTYTTEADFKAIENAVARIQIPKGNQISKYAITSLSPEAGLSSKIPVQMRGYMISVPLATASMIKPDDNVDVLLTFEAVMKNGSRQKVALTLLQNVKVLGVGSDLGQGLDARSANAMKSKDDDAAAYSDNSTLALALSPRDAQYLALAEAEGGKEGISVILRSHGDVNNYLMEIATFEKLFN